MGKEYITNQIAVYKTDKKLIEFKDKLKYASVLNYAHIHSYAEKDEYGRNVNSNIGVVIQDYSNGTGDNTIKVGFNMSPKDIKYVFSRLNLGQANFELKQEKIWPFASENGKNFVSKLSIKRASVGKDGKPRNYPWTILIENGYGTASKAQTGGTYIMANSYKAEKTVFVNINDKDMFCLLDEVTTFINAWESYYGKELIVMRDNTISAMNKENATEKPVA